MDITTTAIPAAPPAVPTPASSTWRRDLTLNPDALPAAIRGLAEAIGGIDTLRLIGQHGGARVQVPKKPTEDHPLRMVMSAAGFELLVRLYGGELLDLPKGDAFLRRLRHDQVRQCREAGLKVDDIAETTGYTRRHVINILSGRGDLKDTWTMDMFEETNPVSTPQAGRANDPFGLARR